MEGNYSVVRIIEKRARRALPRRGALRNARIAVVNDGSCEGEVNAYLMKKLVKACKKAAQLRKAPKEGLYEFVAIPETADQRAARFLDFMLSSKRTEGTRNPIMLLKDTLRREAASYARIKRIKYAKKGKKASEAGLLLEKLEKGLKGATFSLSKASNWIIWQQTR